MILQCKCKWEGQPDLSHKGPHIKASCPECKKFIKFVKQIDMDSGDEAILADWVNQQDEKENKVEVFVGQESIGKVSVELSNMPRILRIGGYWYQLIEEPESEPINEEQEARDKHDKNESYCAAYYHKMGWKFNPRSFKNE